MKRVNRPGFTALPTAVAIGLLAVLSAFPVFGDAANESESRLLKDIKYLASDELEGRGVGTNGLNKAADFVRNAFREAGLDVTSVEGEAFQPFTMTTGSKLGKTNTLAFTGPDGKSINLKINGDFQTCSFGGAGKFDGGIVFGGYAIDAKKKEYQDFADVDLKGKIVIVMRRNPQQGNPHGKFGGGGPVTVHASLRTKVSNAFGKGAAAILFVNDPYSIRKNAKNDNSLVEKETGRVVAAAEALVKTDAKDAEKTAAARKKLADTVKRLNAAKVAAGKADDDDPLMRFGYGGNASGNSIPILHVTAKAVDQLLQASLKKSLADLEAEIDKDVKPQTTALKGWKATGETSLEVTKVEVKNVIGVLEGEGPLADETVVIGAHYDHVGMGGQGSLAPGSKAVHNGADDNASGTVALIELARRFGSRDKKPARRIVFIAFTAEERGLIGSAHYVKNPVFPLDKTIAMLNMDMVGRVTDDKLVVYGIGTTPRWKKLIEAEGKKHNFKLTLKEGGFGPSDHSSFYGKKMPVLHFFSGTHKDYHRPTDDWDKINLAGMSRVVQMVEEIADNTIATKERPKYIEVKRKSTQARTGSRPYFGSIPDFAEEAKGYAIMAVAGGSPAEKGGLKGGDVIVGLGGQKIGNLSDFDLALRKFKAGDEVDIVVQRKGKEVKLKVILGKPR
jgi:acetylornithine deacetylase/succinyl-diaminopimelate desuccinylase-like protein